MIAAIGDIHGEITKLERLCAMLPKEAHLVFLGDYVDRGESPEAVLDFFAAIKNNATFLMGNHEEMMLHNPKQWEHYGDIENREKLIAKLPTMHEYYIYGDYYLSHAGFSPEFDLPHSSLDAYTLRWQRIFRRQEEANANWKGKGVVGHTPKSSPIITEHLIGIDTGACYGGPLTAILLPEERIFQAK